MITVKEMSKTYQYRKVIKPQLERKRRARINKCLDDLKELLVECMQQNGQSNVKLEKADILEVTVQHLRKLKTHTPQQNAYTNNTVNRQSFRNGYIHAANEVSRCLASLPKVDVAFGTKFMTHLGLRLNQLESAQEMIPTSINMPLTLDCSTTNFSRPISPSSSGYASDNDSLSSSPSVCHSTQGLLKMSCTSLWRPW
uniref:BHLH domain-containing protein n=1 Tax=Glossina brevipalpis TaxID=37001 RepID=A0A1A9X2P7_9MUSC